MSEHPSSSESKDIVDYKKRITLLEAENTRLRGFIDIGRTLGTEHRFEKLIPMIIEKISLHLNCERSTLFMVDWQKGQLWSQYAQGLTTQTVTIDLKIGLAGTSFLSDRIINVTDAYEHRMFNPYFDHTTGFRTRSVLCVPIRSERHRPYGVIQLLNRKTGAFTQDDERFVLRSIEAFTPSIEQGRIQPDQVIQWLQHLRSTIDFERGTLFLHDPKTNKLISRYAEGLKEGDSICLDLHLGIAGHVAVTGTRMNILDAYADPRFDRRTDDQTGFHTRNILCVPISNAKGEIVAVLQAINKKQGAFTDSDLNLLTSMASIIAIAVENALLFSEQRNQFKSLLQVMAASIDAKDTLTAGHSEMVEKLSLAIGRKLGLNEQELDILSVAALLHDYGKIGIDDYILKKPGKLTPEEYAQIQKHVDITYHILSKMYFARNYLKVPIIAASHHERLDGSGYSHGSRDEDIPWMGKIIAVADVYEALTANRHYRNAMSPEKAFEILKEEVSKGKLDETIVKALESCIVQKTDSESTGP